MNKQKQGFTLVELIVVITILAILGTIAIMAFSGYSKNARDSARLSDIGSIKQVLELWILQSGTYPDSSNGTGVTYSGSVVWNQGTFGDSVFQTVGKLDKKPKDPLYDIEYTYSVTNSKKEYQIASVLEKDMASNLIIPQTYAATSGKAYVTGKYNGIIATIKGSSAYIIALPSIILSDLTTTDLKLISSNTLVYEGKSNLPASYKNLGLSMTGSDFNFIPVEVWSGASLTELNNQTIFQNLVINLQSIYKSNSIFSSLPEYKDIAGEADYSQVAMGSIKSLVETNMKQSLTNINIIPVFTDCSLSGTLVPHGTNITVYQTPTVPYGNICSSVSQTRTCNNGDLSGTYTNISCTPLLATGTFTLSSTGVIQGGNVTISNNCGIAPTSYNSSNTSVATISGATITTIIAGTTIITPTGGACSDTAGKTLTVNSPPSVGQNMSLVGGEPALYAGKYFGHGKTLWVAGVTSTTKQWKTTATSTANTSNTLDGRLNTGVNDITYNGNTRDTGHPAGDYCANLNWAGYSDWYTPSMVLAKGTTTNCGSQNGELNFLYCLYKNQPSLGFTDVDYCSSTQYNSTTAICMGFNYTWASYEGWNPKTTAYGVRCIRVAD